jgi:hypothetical protein
MMAGALHWYGEACIDPRHAKSNRPRRDLHNSGDLEAAEQAFRAGLSFHPTIRVCSPAWAWGDSRAG